MTEPERILTELGSVRSEIADMRADIAVLTAIVMRQDTTLRHLLAELAALHAQHARFNARLAKLEDAAP